MTWQEFKEAVEDQNVTDETKLLFINWSGDDTPEVTLEKGNVGCIE